MIQRIVGETLAISDRVAMMPTVHPAAAGTHQYLDERRVKVTVIGRDNMRLTGEMGGTADARSRMALRTRGAERQWLPDGAGVLLARALARFVWGGTGFTERQLQGLQTLAHRPGVGSKILGRGGDQSGQRRDQPACLIEIATWTVVRVLGRKAELLGGGAHQHHSRPGDHLHGR